MVGDNFDRDCRAAKQAGLRAIWLRRDDAEPPQPGIADRVIAHLSEIELEQGAQARR
jgi:FMN phosphatase YigB (HAD superfamily)